MKKLVNKVLVGGCFDILHFGHIKFLKKAKSLGDYLVIALESDNRVHELKGKNRPIHTQRQRKEMLESLRFVNEVIILKNKMTDEDYFKLVDRIKPSIIATTKGDFALEKKKSQAKMIGAKVVVLPKTKSPSTTEIIKNNSK